MDNKRTLMILLSVSSGIFFVTTAFFIWKYFATSNEIFDLRKEIQTAQSENQQLQVLTNKQKLQLADYLNPALDAETLSDCGGGTTLTFNEGDLELEKCWYVDEVISKYDDLTDEELTEIGPTLSGIWPIQKKFVLGITNGDTIIKFNHTPIFVPDGVGDLPHPLEEDFTVIEEPIEEPKVKSDNENLTPNMYGMARKPIANGYEFHLITLGDGSFDAKYFDYSVGLYNAPTLEFIGSEDDLDYAEEFYHDVCVENISGWCY